MGVVTLDGVQYRRTLFLIDRLDEEWAAYRAFRWWLLVAWPWRALGAAGDRAVPNFSNRLASIASLGAHGLRGRVFLQCAQICPNPARPLASYIGNNWERRSRANTIEGLGACGCWASVRLFLRHLRGEARNIGTPAVGGAPATPFTFIFILARRRAHSVPGTGKFPARRANLFAGFLLAGRAP